MDGAAKSGGTWATELHGGSDVGATTTVARAEAEAWRLTGLKWFTSNADSGLALATGRPEGGPEGGAGLGCYLLPDTLPDGAPNRYRVRRLKDKLGTRGLPTGEVDLEGAWALEIAGPGDGLKVMMEALGYSRIHNAVAACGVQRRALLEALCWASHREAFGAAIWSYPMVRDTLLDLAAEAEASTALAFEAGLAFDAALAAGDSRENARDWLRTATALAKYRTAEHGVRAAFRAIEIVGGNGYTEEWPTARLFRDAMVLPVWEGPVNIQALELLRATTGKLGGDGAFLARVAGILEARGRPAPRAPPARPHGRHPGRRLAGRGGGLRSEGGGRPQGPHRRALRPDHLWAARPHRPATRSGPGRVRAPARLCGDRFRLGEYWSRVRPKRHQRRRGLA
jgi:alkylation response protein AidB-like acyl-CoA dehydrogenase